MTCSTVAFKSHMNLYVLGGVLPGSDVVATQPEFERSPVPIPVTLHYSG